MALQHLRSSTANKRPLPAGMSDGQLAINTNSASPGLFFKDSAGNLVKAGPVHVGTTAPNISPASGGATGNSTGELWLDTSVTPNQLKTWNGSAWVSDFPDEIPVAKLADGAARQLLQTDAAGTGVEWTSNVDVPGTLDVTSTATFDSIASHPLGSAGAPTITFTGDTNTGLYSPGADQVAISTNGTQRINIEADGDINIDSGGVFYDATNNRLAVGTTSPGALVDASASSGTRIRSTYTSTGSSRDAGFEIYGDGAVNSSFVYAGNTGVTTITSYLGTVLSVGGSERARIDSSGRLGVGTSAPNYQLHVTSDFAVGAAGFNQQLTFSNDTIQSLLLGTGYTALKLNPLGGNVGVGTASPGSYSTYGNKLVVYGTGTDGPGITIATGTSDTGSLYFADGTTGNEVARGAVQYAHASDALLFQTAATERARIDSSGRLLVGTSSNSGNSIFLVQGHTTSSGAGIIDISSGSASPASGTGIGYIRFKDTGSGASNYQYAYIACEVDGTSSSATDLPGRLVFSTTADGASSPTERMRIDNSGSHALYSDAQALVLSTNQASSSSLNLVLGRYGATGVNGGTDCFVIRSNGNVLNSNNSYGSLSDIKLKENIVDAGPQWNDIKALQVRNYNFKEGQTHRQIGLIAQEVEPISPGLVYESPDRDAEGNDLGTVTKSVNYSVLYMKAVKALQEAMERIETLEQRLNDAGIN